MNWVRPLFEGVGPMAGGFLLLLGGLVVGGWLGFLGSSIAATAGRRRPPPNWVLRLVRTATELGGVVGILTSIIAIYLGASRGMTLEVIGIGLGGSVIGHGVSALGIPLLEFMRRDPA